MQLLWKSLGLSPCDTGAQWGVLSRVEVRSGPGPLCGVGGVAGPGSERHSGDRVVSAHPSNMKPVGFTGALSIGFAGRGAAQDLVLSSWTKSCHFLRQGRCREKIRSPFQPG